MEMPGHTIVMMEGNIIVIAWLLINMRKKAMKENRDDRTYNSDDGREYNNEI